MTAAPERRSAGPSPRYRYLPEDCRVTDRATEQMACTIKRRDSTKPAFWYLSYTHPHPPQVAADRMVGFPQ